MAKDDKFVLKIGDDDLPRDEAINRAIQVKVSTFSGKDHPSLESVKTLILQEGKQVIKLVKCWDIRSQHTGEYKFSNLVFATLRKTKKRGWEFETRRSITLGDKNNPDMVERLIRFLSSIKSLDTSGDVFIVGANGIDKEKLAEALKVVSGTGQQSVLISQIIEWINQDQQALEQLTELSSDDILRSQSLVAAITYSRYHKAIIQLKKMIEDNLPERDYQKFLEENHWIFGSEYSELINKRSLVVGQQLDFPLRRTVDGYLDVIEIKTPLKGKSGFIRDGSHDNYYPGTDIHKNTSQVLNYLNALEADRHRIMVHDRIDVTKVRGKLIIGRDGSEEEQEARRLYNANQKSIEVMSFDGLIRIGQRILQIMVDENPNLKDVQSVSQEEIQPNDLDDIPF
jgi:hypothetical protein